MEPVDGLKRATVLPDFTISIVKPCCTLAKKLDQCRTISVAVAFMKPEYAFYIFDASPVSFTLAGIFRHQKKTLVAK